jgi:prephenate dehydrogenase
MTQKKYLIVGCGLIGGSIARKLRVIDQDCIIDYFDKKDIESGLLTKYKFENKHTYDVVFQTIDYLPKIDFTKIKLLVKLHSYAGYNNYVPKILLVGVHFMAGSEKSGFENSSATLFDGCNFSVIQYENDETHKEILSEIEPLIKRIANSSEPILSVSPEEHNVNVAYTSHLLHFLALKIPQFSKLPSLQRISQSNKKMWEEIFKKNEKNIMYALGKLLETMYQYRTDFNNHIYFLCYAMPKNFKGSAYYEVVGNLDEKN